MENYFIDGKYVSNYLTILVINNNTKTNTHYDCTSNGNN